MPLFRAPLLLSTPLLLTALAASSGQAAEDYTPPPVPKLYEPASQEELNNAPKRPRSHFFIAGGVSFGQSRSAGNEDPIAAYGSQVDFGYSKALDSWSRLEMGMGLSTGVAGHSAADLALKAGVMAKLGYGYSLGGQLFGIIRGGFGAVFVGYEDEVGGQTRKNPSNDLGTAAQLGYILAMPVSDKVGLQAGFTWTHLSVQVPKVESSAGSQRINKGVVVNIPSLELGLRVSL